MSKTFDDVVLEHKESLAKNLIDFDEGKRVRKLLLDVDANVSDYEYYFQAGQQSRQAEIDALQKRISVYEKHVGFIKNIHESEFNSESDTSWILGNLDGFFECLEIDLKGGEND